MPLSELILSYCQFDTKEKAWVKFESKYNNFQEDDFENVYKMASILFKPRCVNLHRFSSVAQVYTMTSASVFNSVRTVTPRFTECLERRNMAWSYVWRTWLLFQCAAYPVTCNGVEQCKECQGPLVQNSWVTLFREDENGGFHYIGGNFLRVVPNNSFVSTPLIKVWIRRYLLKNIFYSKNSHWFP